MNFSKSSLKSKLLIKKNSIYSFIYLYIEIFFKYSKNWSSNKVQTSNVKPNINKNLEQINNTSQIYKNNLSNSNLPQVIQIEKSDRSNKSIDIANHKMDESKLFF